MTTVKTMDEAIRLAYLQIQDPDRQFVVPIDGGYKVVESDRENENREIARYTVKRGGADIELPHPR